MLIDFTSEDLKIIEEGLKERVDRMFRDHETYRLRGNKEASMDCLDEFRKAMELRERVKKLIPVVEEKDLIRHIIEHGEDDGNGVFRIYLNGLNGAVEHGSFTDIIAAVVSEDYRNEEQLLEIQVNTPDDSDTVFESFSMFDSFTQEKIVEQVLSYKK
jgi:hypothetical protein